VAKNKIFKTSVSILLALVVGGIILYPKLKPLWNAPTADGLNFGSSASRGGNQPLFASGYVLVPTSMNELI
jgi:membrane fusion protein (multidrug efflux system)